MHSWALAEKQRRRKRREKSWLSSVKCATHTHQFIPQALSPKEVLFTAKLCMYFMYIKLK